MPWKGTLSSQAVHCRNILEKRDGLKAYARDAETLENSLDKNGKDPKSFKRVMISNGIKNPNRFLKGFQK